MALTLESSERLEFLDKLEQTLEEFITKQQHALHREYEFLDIVMKHQGVSTSGRVSANMDKLKGLAQVQEILPTFLLGKFRKDSQEDALVGLPTED